MAGCYALILAHLIRSSRAPASALWESRTALHTSCCENFRCYNNIMRVALSLALRPASDAAATVTTALRIPFFGGVRGTLSYRPQLDTVSSPASLPNDDGHACPPLPGLLSGWGLSIGHCDCRLRLTLCRSVIQRLFRTWRGWFLDENIGIQNKVMVIIAL